jgi:RimJ/RimL family protein N-acetyltransferase
MAHTYALEIPVAPQENLYLKAVENTPEEVERLMDFVYAPGNHEHLTEFESWASRLDHDEAKEKVERAVSDMELDNALEYRIMQRGSTEDVMLGGVSLHSRTTNHRRQSTPQQSAQLGYYVGHNARGRGYVSRSARKLLNYASYSDVWDLRRVDLMIDPKNTASQWVARSLGAMIVSSSIASSWHQQWSAEWKGLYPA